MNYPVWRTPSQRGFDPWGELYALRSELGRIVGSALSGQRSWADVDLDETDDGWMVTARLPGVAPDEVEVEVDDRDLCIRARSEAEVSADTGEARGSQRRGFEYHFTIPGEVDPEAVDATMDHGLLTVRLPRSKRSQRRQISIGRRAKAAGPEASTTSQGSETSQGSTAPEGATQ